jgi:hypothetical protein
MAPDQDMEMHEFLRPFYRHRDSMARPRRMDAWPFEACVWADLSRTPEAGKYPLTPVFFPYAGNPTDTLRC